MRANFTEVYYSRFGGVSEEQKNHHRLGRTSFPLLSIVLRPPLALNHAHDLQRHLFTFRFIVTYLNRAFGVAGAHIDSTLGEEFWGYSSVGRASQTRYPTFVPYFVPYFVLFSTHNPSQNGKGFGKQETHQTLDFTRLDALFNWWR